MRADDHIRRLLRQSDRMPAGEFEHVILTSAIELSDQLGDRDLAYRARLRMSAWAAASGRTGERLRAFDWCLERHLADPIRFPAQIDDLDLRWEFATVPRLLAADPGYSTTAIDGCLDEMLQAYSPTGTDLGAYWLARFELAIARGDHRAARMCREKLAGPHPADSLLCEACLVGAELHWHLENARPDRAIDTYNGLIARGLSCADEPERSGARMVVALATSGRVHDARRLRDQLTVASPHPNDLAVLALGMSAALLLGDLEEGLVLVEQQLHRIAADPHAAETHFAVLTASGGILTALVRGGCGATPVRLRDAARLSAALGGRVGQWTARSLAASCWSAAQALAVAFDSRNGTTRYGDRLREARLLVPRAEASTGALFVHDRRLVRSRLRPGVIAGAFRTSFSAPDMGGHLDAAELLELARERAAAEDADGAVLVIARALVRADPSTRAELLALRVRLLVESGRMADAERALEHKIDCLVLDGLDDDAHVDRQLGLLLHGAVAPDAARRFEAVLASARDLPLAPGARLRVIVALAALRFRLRHYADAESLLAAEIARASRGGGRIRSEPALFLLADSLCALGRPGEAVAVLDRLLEAPLDRALRATALLRRSVALDSDQPSPAPGEELFDLAMDDADRALGLFSEIDHCDGALDACGVLADLLGRSGSYPGAIEALLTAHRFAVRHAHPDADAVAFRLACALIRSDRGEQARSLLEDILETEGEKGADCERPGEVAVVLHWLGHACRHDDDDAAAYCAWSAALERFAQCGDELAGIEVEIALGRLLYDNDEKSSIEVLRHAVTTAGRHMDAMDGRSRRSGGARIRTVSRASAQVLLVDALHLLGRAEAAFGHAEGLATLDAAHGAAVRAGLGSGESRAGLLESRARALDDLGREREAAALARQAAEAYRTGGDAEGQAEIELFERRLLAITALAGV